MSLWETIKYWLLFFVPRFVEEDFAVQIIDGDVEAIGLAKNVDEEDRKYTDGFIHVESVLKVFGLVFVTTYGSEPVMPWSKYGKQ